MAFSAGHEKVIIASPWPPLINRFCHPRFKRIERLSQAELCTQEELGNQRNTWHKNFHNRSLIEFYALWL